MSELFDKEVNAQKESLKKTSGVHASSRMPTKKCAMKMKQRRSKRRARKNVFGGRKPFIRRTQRTGENDLNKLRVNDSGHNEGTIWCQGDGFFERGRMNGAIKLAMAGTQDWWRRFSPLLGYCFYIVRTC